MFKTQEATAVAPQGTEVQNEIQVLTTKLAPYNSCFGVDYENLLYLFNDQMNGLSDELRKGHINDAQNRLNMMFTLFWVIKDKLSSDVFDNIEILLSNIKYHK